MDEQTLFYPAAPTAASRFCRNGHWVDTAADRRGWNGNCCPNCTNAAARKRWLNKRGANSRMRGAAGVSLEYRLRARRMAAEAPDAYKQYRQAAHYWAMRRSNLGVDKIDWLRMYYQQNRMCALCDASLDTSPAFCHIDHDHETGRVRGLLCARCNQGMVYIDRPDWVAKAQRYRNGET